MTFFLYYSVSAFTNKNKFDKLAFELIQNSRNASHIKINKLCKLDGI